MKSENLKRIKPFGLSKKEKNILDHRPSLISNKKEIDACFPPDLLRYKIHFFEQIVNL